MPYTQGFDAGLDDEHYKRHVIERREFVNLTLRRYCDKADHFLGAPLQSLPGTDECIRPNGDVLRYNDATQEFGVLHVGGIIGTYFRVTMGRHGFATNREYFEYRCTQ